MDFVSLLMIKGSYLCCGLDCNGCVFGKHTIFMTLSTVTLTLSTVINTVATHYLHLVFRLYSQSKEEQCLLL